jgi:hypothetical protein
VLPAPLTSLSRRAAPRVAADRRRDLKGVNSDDRMLAGCAQILPPRPLRLNDQRVSGGHGGFELGDASVLIIPRGLTLGHAAKMRSPSTAHGVRRGPGRPTFASSQRPEVVPGPYGPPVPQSASWTIATLAELKCRAGCQRAQAHRSREPDYLSPRGPLILALTRTSGESALRGRPERPKTLLPELPHRQSHGLRIGLARGLGDDALVVQAEIGAPP